MPLVRADCIVPGDLIDVGDDFSLIIRGVPALALVISNRVWSLRSPRVATPDPQCIEMVVSANGHLNLERIFIAPEERILNVIFRP